MDDVSGLSIKAKTKILKYNPGCNIDSDNPYEIVEQEVIFTGDQAIHILNQIKGGNGNVINKCR